MEEHEEDAEERIEVMLSWLRGLGARGLDNFRVRRTAHSGMGVFCVDDVSQGGEIASIPREAVMTTATAAMGKVGRAVNLKASPLTVLWLDMACGRNDEEHGWHPYLRSLPSQPDDLASWSDVKKQECQRLSLLLEVDFSAVRWARSMWISRRFVNDDDEEGCMLPFFDLLNHAPDAAVSYRVKADSDVTFYSVGGVAAGAEVFNCYGADKSNEELLLTYGFAIWDNPADTFRLTVYLENPISELGPFHISRGDVVFPPALWRALADPAGFLAGEEAAGDPPRAVLESLLATLRSTLAPFEATADDDKRHGDPGTASQRHRRTTMVARYRDGQRRVLQGAVALLSNKISMNRHDSSL